MSAQPPPAKAALLLIDVQYDFLPPSGSLAVPCGLEVLGPIYRLLDLGKWDRVVASQDYHPPSHISFASRHPPHKPFQSISLLNARTGEIKQQDLWPEHCVQGTEGAEIVKGVQEKLEKWGAKIVRKGTDENLDAYSAFALPLSADPSSTPSLTKDLLAHQITHLFIVGLATDYCVRASVLDALAQGRGWEVFVVREACRGVQGEREEEVLRELEKKGARVVSDEGPEVGRWLKE